jgi:Family of unknown function (DUF5946)
VPDIDGPVHAYIRVAPGCWQRYGEVLAREYGRGGFGSAHRLTVDTYAVQHPQNRDRRNRQSVALHLMSLCLVLGRGEDMQRARSAIAEHAERHRGSEFPWLEPPASLGELTVLDVHAAQGPAEHVEGVRAWAASAWNVWSQHHARVRGWLDSRDIA